MLRAQPWTRSRGLLLSAIIPAALSQTVSTEIEACAILDCSLATYILIGIAAFYSLLSLICIVLICVACKCSCCRKRTRSKVQPYSEELDDAFPNSALDTIKEESTEDFFKNKRATKAKKSEAGSSSQSSLGSDSADSDESDKDTSLVIKKRAAKKKAEKTQKQSSGYLKQKTHQPKGSTIPPKESPDFFENKHAANDDESEAAGSSSQSSSADESDKDTSLVIKNRSAKKMTGKVRTQSPGTTLQTHQPKGSPIPPKKVPVPFSESDGTEKPLEHTTYPPGHGPVRLPPIAKTEGTPRQRRAAAAEKITTPQGDSRNSSPFHSRKNPRSEIAQDADKGTPTMKKKMKKIASPAGSLSTSTSIPIDESALKFEMVKISSKWRKVGRAFTLSATVLNNISIICSNNNDTCMLRICEEWLRLRKERDWSELIEILQSEEINEKRLAEYLRMYYYKADSEDFGRKSSEGNLSFYFMQDGTRGSRREPKIKREEKEDEAEGSTTWIN